MGGRIEGKRSEQGSGVFRAGVARNRQRNWQQNRELSDYGPIINRRVVLWDRVARNTG